ncbi:hypothetical protein ABLE92_09570 [Gordonia sp. VNQ95]|uniref:hypothetical protein n=1 Tax=Gordonia sp. VNQ95 TaxID=3156619 RepID=UPI0032B463A3
MCDRSLSPTLRRRTHQSQHRQGRHQGVRRYYGDKDGLYRAVLDIFRTDDVALDVHLAINSFCFFRVDDRYSWKTLFARDLAATDQRDRQRKMLGDMIVAYLTDTHTGTGTGTDR